MSRSVVLVANCGSRARTEPAPSPAEPEPTAGAEPVAAEPVVTGRSFPAEASSRRSPTAHASSAYLRLRFRDGLGWARASYRLDATCGEGNPALRSMRYGLARPDGTLAPASAGAPLPEVESLGGSVCSAWIPEAIPRKLLAATPVPAPFIVGRSSFSAENLASSSARRPALTARRRAWRSSQRSRADPPTSRSTTRATCLERAARLRVASRHVAHRSLRRARPLVVCDLPDTSRRERADRAGARGSR